MQLYYIRHGQSLNNKLWVETGGEAGRSEDPHLSPLGERQAIQLANFLSTPRENDSYLSHDPSNSKGFNFTRIYSSLMWRALATATYTADFLDMPIYGLEEIHEGGGIYLQDAASGELVGLPGKTAEELKKAFPRLQFPEEANPQGWWNRPFEKRELRFERAKRALRKLLDRHGNSTDRIALFSHGGFYNYFIAAMMQLDEIPGIWFDMNNCAISRFDLHDDGFVMVYHNRVSHFCDELIT
jgi:2,3-bisphosphoglycerate-dependent phosphoglycerate mutase